MIFFNSFIISGIYFVAYWYFSNIQKHKQGISIFLSAIITLLPSFFLAGKTVMTEPSFILMSGILFLLVKTLRGDSPWWKWFLVGFLSFLLFLIRLNGSIFLGLNFLYIALYFFPKNKKSLLWFLLGIFPLFVLKTFIQKYVFEDEVSLFYSTGVSIFQTIFSFLWLKNVFGYFVYVSIASFFTIPLFFVDFFRKRKFEPSTLVFLFAFLFNILLISIVFQNGDRFDHHFYGRYIDAFILPLMLVSFDSLFVREKHRNIDLLVVLLVFLLSLLFMYKPDQFERTNVYSVFPLLSFFEVSSKGFFLGIMFYLLSALVFYYLKYQSRFLILTTIIFVSLSGYFIYFFDGAIGRRSEVNIPFYLNDISKDKDLIYVDRSLFHEYLFSAYSLFLPNIVSLNDYSVLENLKEGFLISEKNFNLKNAYLLTFENHQNLALYTFDFDLYNRLKEEKKVVFDDVVTKDLSVAILKLFDFSFGRGRIVKFEVKNESDFPWVTYFPSRHSKFETHEISLREYCFDGDKIVGEKRRHFDSIIYPGRGQEFLFYTVSPVCSKITYDVVQEGYMGFTPILEIDLK